MKKKFVFTLTLLSCLSLTACGHKHTFADATCTEPMTCTKCDATEGEALGHTWEEATCDTAKTCTVCEATEGDALGHTWADATCDTAKTCTVCGATEGNALGHTWEEATCDTAKSCSVCGATEGNPLEHSWIEATTEAPKTCELCGLTDGYPLEDITNICNNTIPEDEVQWYLDNFGLTREQFNELTDEQISQMAMDWLSNGYTGGGSGSGGSSGDNTPSADNPVDAGGDNDLPTAELGDPDDAPAGTMGGYTPGGTEDDGLYDWGDVPIPELPQGTVGGYM